MTRDARRCPDPEILAAFVAGSLHGAELTTVTEHLRDCEDCRIVVAEATLVNREEQNREEQKDEERGEAQPSRWWPWWLAAAAAALAGIVYLGFWRPPSHDHDLVQSLVAASPRNERYIEARVSGGFPWAPMRPVHREPDESLNSDRMKLIGASGTVLEKTAHDPSIEAQHAAAIARLLAGHPEEAADLLGKLAPRASDPHIWSDLSAARYAAALRNDDPSQVAEALPAADEALRLDPKLPEALFNRALIIDRLGLRVQARAAWEKYLTVDAHSGWALEAQRHIGALRPVAQFRDELARRYDVLTADANAAAELARRFPQDARTWGETEILGRWAEAQQKRSPAAAAHLRLARAIGEQVVSNAHDRMLLSAVEAVEKAGPAGKRALADAHLRFRDGQKHFREDHPGEAEALFLEAAAQFRRGGSPVELLARYFAASTRYEQGHINEARLQLEELQNSAPTQFPALHAQVEWELGLSYAALGRWGDAIHTLSDSTAAFEQLGEKQYATSVRNILAQVYDRIGDPHTAWQHRLIALPELGHSEGPRLQEAVQSIARGAAIRRDWPVSFSFLNLTLDMAGRVGDDLLLAETLLVRASVEGRLAESAAAKADLASAARAVARLHDAKVRESADADRLAVAGILARNPADAAAMLGRAIEFHRVKGRHMFLPELLLHRGRALIALGNGDTAEADIEAGIHELEVQRSSLEAGEMRWGVFATADELFEDAVTLALQRGNDSKAFSYAERARARQLLESITGGWALPQPALFPAGDAILIEYAALPAHLVIFVVDHGRVHATQQSVPRAVIQGWVDRLERSALQQDEAQFRLTASALYACVLAPVANGVPAGRTLVFVPDATLSKIPFAALIDAHGHYLIESHPVIVAPSAAVFARLQHRAKTATEAPPRVLIIAGPAAVAGELEPLSAAGREAAAIAAAYLRPALSAPADSDRALLEKRAASAEIIHFVGHSEPRNGGDIVLVASRLAGAAGRLTVRDVAAMRFRRTRVVVLAACRTGRGQERGGEGTISIARGFIAAGVPSVVSTLWPIEDGLAAGFFPLLHRHLAAGLPAAEALRATQLECIHRGDAATGVWAAVQVLGS